LRQQVQALGATKWQTILFGQCGHAAPAGEVALADVHACSDCILSFRNQGGFSSVLPGFPGNLQLKGVIEIQVK